MYALFINLLYMYVLFTFTDPTQNKNYLCFFSSVLALYKWNNEHCEMMEQWEGGGWREGRGGVAGQSVQR